MAKKKKKDTSDYKHWKVVTSCMLKASAEEVWDMVGGFYTINNWCPDISDSGVQRGQSNDRDIRRKIIFPGQPAAWEQLTYMDNENMKYRYKWYKGPWGEMIQQYHSEIEVIEVKPGKMCLMKWTGWFYYKEDAITTFYHNGYKFLIDRFGGKILK